MTTRIKTERRQYPRIEHKLAVKIAANGYDFTTATQNVSCVGTYCHIDKYIPPFTRVALKLSLPIKSIRQEKNYSVECKGVIVRTEDDNNQGFNIAVLFNEIKDGQRRKISQYINQFLP